MDLDYCSWFDRLTMSGTRAHVVIGVDMASQRYGETALGVVLATDERPVLLVALEDEVG